MPGKGKTEGCCPTMAKWLLIAFNVLFCLIAIGLIAAGVYAYVQLSDYLAIVENKMINAPAIVLIAFGCITLIIAAIGCIGACKESACLLFTFAAIIGILVLAELVTGIVAFVYRDKVNEFVGDNASILLKTYDETEKENPVTIAWNTAHEKLGCCGVKGPADWNATKQLTIPKSCGTNTDGCEQKLINFLKKNIYVVGGVGVAFAVIQLLGIMLACCVGCNVRKGTNA